MNDEAMIKCEDCEYEVVRKYIGAGLPMCDHPLLMASPHGRYGGKFTGHYGEEDPPYWCPKFRPDLYIMDPDRKEIEMEKRIHKAILNIPIGQLYPHPGNPRKDVGDVEELAKSIRVNGLMQNLTVIPKDPDGPVTPGSDFTVLIGHRRLAASKQAGLAELPCRIIEGLSEREQLSTMLEENMQRSDLTIYEQAEGFQMMLDLGETMETIKEKTGFSETTIRHRLNIAKLDKKKLKEAEESFQISIKDLTLLEAVKDIKTRNRILSECRDHRDFEWKVRSAEQEEKRDEAEKQLFKLLDKFDVKKAPENFSPYGAGIVTVKEFNLDGKLPKKSFKWDVQPPEGAELMYYRGYGGFVKIVYKGKPPKAGKTPQEKERDQVEKNRKKIRAIMKGFAADRRNFVLDVVNRKYEKAEDPEKNIKDCYELLLRMNTSISFQELAGYLSGKSYWDLTEDEKKELQEQAKKLSMEHSLLIFADGRVGGETALMDYEGHFMDKGEEYSDSLFYLRELLGILARYGFQVENEEVAALLDGISELYKPKEGGE